MSKVAFKRTQAQHRAITLTGKNILVSAAAGSGKTAVLTERVVHHILQGVPIENLVVLTFTNAAAKEMKTRIRKKLQSTDNDLAKKALETLELAHIQTFDSFALFIVKKYGYLSNISPLISVMDSLTLNITKQRLIDDLFERYYAEENPQFLAYIDTYTSRNDGLLKEQIIDFNDALSLYYNRVDIIEQIQVMYTEKTFNHLFKRYVNSLKRHQGAIRDALHQIQSFSYVGAVHDYVQSLQDHFRLILQAQDNDAFVFAFQKLGRMPSIAGANKSLNNDGDFEAIKRLNAIKDKLAQAVKTLKSLCDKETKSHRDAFFKTFDHIPIISQLIADFEHDLDQYQHTKEQFDFNRIAHKALALIENHDNVKTTLKSTIKEVMIDEYQDTSLLQERCIEAITSANVFMVGDIKQSIYRFRHADPQLFMTKYENYRLVNDAEVIDLNLNFRSRKTVLDAVNTLFSPLMDKTVGGVDYDDKQRLVYGLKAYDNAFDNDTPYGLQLYTFNPEDYEEQLKKFKLKTLEIMWMATHIKSQKNRISTYDDGQLRKANWGDFVIVCDRTSDFATFTRWFEAYNIPLMVHKEASMIDLAVLDVMRNILRLLRALSDETSYQKDFKHAFYSVTRSFLLRYDDDVLIRQMLNLPKSLPSINALRYVVLPELKMFFETLFKLVTMHHLETLDTVLETIVQDFDFYQGITFLEHTQTAHERLEFILDLGREKSRQGMHVYTFLEYLEFAKNNSKQDIDYLPLKALDASRVHLMTIHKAKGLEFPHLYVAHLGNTFNVQVGKSYDFDPELGFIIEHDNDGLDMSFLKHLKSEDDGNQDISERLRVLYVAMTRAKESIHLCVPYTSKDIPVMDLNLSERQSMRSFKAMLLAVFKTQEMRPIDIENLISSAPKINDKTIDIDTAETTKIYRKQPDYSATIQPHSYSQGSHRLLDVSTLKVIDQGLLLHEVLEMVDLMEDPDILLNKMPNHSLEKDVLSGLIRHPLMRSLDIKQVYKEFPFSFVTDTRRINGFIDLLIETNDKFLVIDYKLKNIQKEAYISQVQGYMRVIESMTNRPVEGYLYSLIDQTFERVEQTE